jgi:ParB-like chromosome segregation protein Spo0J
MAALHIIERLPGELRPSASNARTHSAKQIAQIARSITTFGFNNPVLVDAAGEIIAGHGRVLAALELGLGRVPTVRLDHLSPAQKRAYVIADNRLEPPRVRRRPWVVSHAAISMLSAAAKY